MAGTIDLTRFIRDVPDFPKPGILFRDITPLLANPQALAAAIAGMAAPWRTERLDAIAAVEARGFLFAVPLALTLGVGVIPVRKPGKLPADTITYEYELEYGRDRLEMHRGILPGGARVLIVDDVADTGHTLNAVINQLRNNYKPITELRSAVIWTKGVSSFKPDYSVDFLSTNPWIHQPFEGYDALRPAQLIEKWKV